MSLLLRYTRLPCSRVQFKKNVSLVLFLLKLLVSFLKLSLSWQLSNSQIPDHNSCNIIGGIFQLKALLFNSVLNQRHQSCRNRFPEGSLEIALPPIIHHIEYRIQQKATLGKSTTTISRSLLMLCPIHQLCQTGDDGELVVVHVKDSIKNYVKHRLTHGDLTMFLRVAEVLDPRHHQLSRD